MKVDFSDNAELGRIVRCPIDCIQCRSDDSEGTARGQKTGVDRRCLWADQQVEGQTICTQDLDLQSSTCGCQSYPGPISQSLGMPSNTLVVHQVCFMTSLTWARERLRAGSVALRSSNADHLASSKALPTQSFLGGGGIVSCRKGKESHCTHSLQR